VNAVGTVGTAAAAEATTPLDEISLDDLMDR